MWKSWNPFKRKQKDDNDTTGEQSGKENLNGKVRVLGNSGFENERARFDGKNGSINEALRQTETTETQGVIRTQENDLSLLRSPLKLSLRNRSVVDRQDQLNNSSTSSHTTNVHKSFHDELNNSNNKGTVFKSTEENNKSFSGVHGPLLSSPIVPQLRRAIESNIGLRRPQAKNGKPVGRSMSMKTGGLNPTMSTAGQLPWVCLKRRGSIGLSDLVSGNIPSSPNTVKLATPEQRHLPSAPSFKTTPLIVTTGACRPVVVDTQTVVSALREKRKRFGQAQQEETFSEDSWQSSAKRRRQDSSQSNASSVSMPSMPESLPNLIGAPGASLLHIENLADRRPSTVPAIDAFMSHQQRMIGLGGPASPAQAQQFYPSPQQQQPLARNVNNSKTVYRSIQSSLSSSQRGMSTLSMLNQHGIDNKRLRGLTQLDSPRKAAAVKSQLDSVSVSSNQETASAASTSSSSTTNQTMITSGSVSSSSIETPVSRQIAEGVVLRRHDLTITPNGNQAIKTSHGNLLVSASDFEMDRKREYKRRVLDLLGGDDGAEQKILPPPSSTALGTMQPSAPGLGLSSAVTSAAVSASLDSLNKLVQSATAPVPQQQQQQSSLASASNANSLSELLKSNEENDVTSKSSAVNASTTGYGLSLTGKPVDSPTSALSSLNSSLQTSTNSTAASSQGGAVFSLGAPVKSGGFSFGVQLNKPGDSLDGSALPGSGLNSASNASAITSSASSLTSAGPIEFNFSAPTTAAASGGGVIFGYPVSQANATSSAGIPGTSSSLQPPTVSSSGQGFSFPSSVGSAAPGFNTPAQLPGFDFQSSSSQLGAPNANKATTSAPSVGFTFGTTSSADSSQAPATGFGGLGSTSVSATSKELNSAPPTAPVDSSQLGFNPGSFTFGTSQKLPTVASSAPAIFGQTAPVNASSSFNSGQSIGSSAFTLGASTANTSSVGSAPFSFGQTALSTASTAPFNFGQAVNLSSGATGSFGFNNTNNVASSGSTLVGFGQPTTSNSNFAPFNFVQTPAATNVSSSSFVPGQTTMANASISFGHTAPTNVSTTSFNFRQIAPTNVSTAPFSFGQGENPTGTNVTPFSFGQPSATTSTSTLGFGPTGTTISSSSPFGFGQQAAAPKAFNTTSMGFGQQTAPLGKASTVSFKQVPNLASSSSANFNFGQGAVTSTASASPYNFGQAANNATKSFGFGAPSTQSGIFGTTQAASMPSSGSVFGSTAAVTSVSSSVFGSGNPSQAFGNASSFGSSTGFGNASTGFGNPSTQSFNPSGTSASFGFSAATTVTPFGSSAAPTSTFGSNATSASTFGSNAPPASTFGSNAAPASTFGSNAAPASTFGSNAAPASTFGFNAAPTSTFGSNATSASTFGSNAPPASTFGSNAAPASTFGSNAAPASTFGSNAAPASTFGSNAAPASTFGSNVAPASTFGSGAAVGSMFGATASKSFSFGSMPASTSTPAFGTATISSAAFGASTPGVSIFGAKPATSSAVFGAAITTTVSSTFATSPGFGASTATQQPAFGGTAPAFGNNQQGSVFNPQGLPTFGSQQGGAGTSGFGTTNPPALFGTPSTQPSFNFAGQSQPTNAFGSQASSNVGFNFGQPTNQPASNSGFNFSAQTPARPTFPTPNPSGGFNFSTMQTPGGAFSFGATPSTPQIASRPRAAARRPLRKGNARR